MTRESEAELVRQVAAGSMEAYRVLLERQLPSVARFAMRMLNDPSEAEDIAQEVLFRLWTQADRYDPSRAKLSTWLHNIAHNLCIDHLRKRGRWHDEPPDDDTLTDDADPADAMLAGIDATIVQQSLRSLPESQRSALILSYYQGLSNRDVASIMAISVEALESLLARARRKMKALMQDRNEHERSR